MKRTSNPNVDKGDKETRTESKSKSKILRMVPFKENTSRYSGTYSNYLKNNSYHVYDNFKLIVHKRSKCLGQATLKVSLDFRHKANLGKLNLEISIPTCQGKATTTKASLYF